MAFEIHLPDLGAGIEFGDVLAVHVSVGDAIEKGQTLIEIETDKATVDVPSPQGGKIAEVHVQTGDTVAINSPIVSLDVVDTGDSSPAPKESNPEVSAPAIEDTHFLEEIEEPIPQSLDKIAPPIPVSVPEVSPSDESVPAGPAIRRLAREVGVDLRYVQGSGLQGRIEREDVLRTVRDLNQKATSTGNISANLVASSHQPSQADENKSDKYGPVRIEKLKKIRKVTAAQMTQSWTTAPRVTNFDDVDITALEELRYQSKDDYAEAGIKLTAMSFLIRAAAVALREHPELNASIDIEHEQIIYKEYLNMGIAVDSNRGLVVPNVKQVDRMSISEIARCLQQTVAYARDNTFEMSTLQGGTFTISNLGAIGGSYSTPIINVPEAAILLVGRSRKMPVVVEDEIVIRLMMPLSLSYDHRLVDGAQASRFLNHVRTLLERPSKLLVAP